MKKIIIYIMMMLVICSSCCYENENDTIKIESCSGDNVSIRDFKTVFANYKAPITCITPNDSEEGNAFLVGIPFIDDANRSVQNFDFTNGVQAAFEQITDNENYYIRFWFVADEKSDKYVSVTVQDLNPNSNTVCYLDATNAVITECNGNVLAKTVGSNVGYGTNCDLTIPAGFKGWIALPVADRKNINANNSNIVALSNVKGITLDIRDKAPNKNSYYVIDELCLSKKASPVENITIQSFNSTTSVDQAVSVRNMTSYGITRPNIKYTNNNVEYKNGLFVDVSSTQDGVAQCYDFTNGVQSAFSQIANNENYYIRFWFVADDNTDQYVAVTVQNYEATNYIDVKNVVATDYRKGKTTIVTAGYGTNSNILVPAGFKGWLAFPISARKGITNNNKISNVGSINSITIDVREKDSKPSSYYVIDELCLSKEVKGYGSKVQFDINDREDSVGIYYTVWFDFWNLTQTVKSGDETLKDNAGKELSYFYNISDGSYQKNGFTYWGEPALGYYNSSSGEIIREHMKQLNAAKVDFIEIDFTNLADGTIKTIDWMTYEQWEDYYKFLWTMQVEQPFTALLDTIYEMRKEGLDTPYVSCWVGAFKSFGAMMSGDTTTENISYYALNRLYNEFYSNPKYKDIFVYHSNKPLICTTTKIDKNYAISNLGLDATYRCLWALQEQNKIVPGEWTNRQKDNSVYGKDEAGNMEELSINVAVAWYLMSYPETADGRNKGITFYNQWANVFAARPKVTIISNWNEWGASYQEQKYPNTNVPLFGFTDEYNQEYSNDIEPMKGGHGDQYYKWLIEYMRAYKAYEGCPTNLTTSSAPDGNPKLSANVSFSADKIQMPANTTWVFPVNRGENIGGSGLNYTGDGYLSATSESDLIHVSIESGLLVVESFGKTGTAKILIMGSESDNYYSSEPYRLTVEVYQGQPDGIMKGDLNINKTIDIIDVRLLLQDYINSSKTPKHSLYDLRLKDMNGDNVIDIIDVRLLLQMYINQ